MNVQFFVRHCVQRLCLLLSLGVAASAGAVAPSFVNQPQGATGYVGASATIDSALVAGSAPVTFQWRKDGANLPGANDRTFTRNPLTLADAGDYTLVATNGDGSAVSNVAHLTVLAAVGPYFTFVPASVTQFEGSQVTLYVNGGGSDPITFQWYKDGVRIEGANLYYLTIATMSQAAVGNYTLKMTNAGGSVTSYPIALSIRLPDPPTIGYYGDPTGTTIYEGQSLSLSAYANGTFPFTVKWKRDGVVVAEQTDISSYTYYSVAATTLADAGSYTATFENVAGSATTTAAVVVVNPAVAPVITRQPESVSVYRSRDFNLSFDYSGAGPVTIQWFHDGVAIQGAVGQWLTINNATDSDGGNYKATATNIKGIATTNEVTVTVNVPPLPTFRYEPSDIAAVQGRSFWLTPTVESVVAATYQWFHNDVAIPDQTSYDMTLYVLTEADAGTYRLAVTNAGGTSYSRYIYVTYVPAEVPVFTSQPLDTSCLPGESATLSAGVACNAAVTYQWFKDEVLVGGANWGSLTIPTDEALTSHVYKLVVSSLGGSVESRSATVVIGPRQPARITAEPSNYYAPQIGGSLSLSASALGTAPLSYQWYRNGTPLPGATSQSLYLNSLTPADIADYHLVVSNSVGSDTSDRLTIRCTVNAPGYPATFWVDATEVGGIYYFLMTNPGRIERYDLENEVWLPTWTIEGNPNAFAVADDSIYVAVQRTITKYPRNWGAGTPLANAAGNVRRMLAVGDTLFASADSSSEWVSTRNRTTGALIQTKTWSQAFSERLAYDPTTRRVFGSGNGYIINVDGTLSDGLNALTANYTSRGGSVLLPGSSKFVDLSGRVFNSADLNYVGRFDGSVDDLAAGDSGYLLLRGSRVISSDLNFGEQASMTIPGRGERMVRKLGSVLVFGQPTVAGAQPLVWKVALSGLRVPTVAAPLAPDGLVFSPDEITSDSNGTIYLLNRLERNILRWSPATKSYLSSIPLPSKTRHFAVSADGSILYSDNGAAQIRKLVLGSGRPEGEPFFVAGSTDCVMQTAGDSLLIGASNDYYPLIAVSAAGSATGSVSLGHSSSREIFWRETGRRIAIRSQGGGISCLSLGSDGRFGADSITSYDYCDAIRVSPTGDLLINSLGYAKSLPSLASAGTLPNAVADVAWADGKVHTMRAIAGTTNTEVATLSADAYLLQRKRIFEGEPVRLFAYGADSVVLVTKRLGKLVFRVLNTTELGEYPASFSAVAYLARHPGLAAAIGDVPDKLERAWQHYLSYGASEGASDFNGDGKSDLVWTNRATDERRLWLLGDSGYGSAASLGTIPGEWVKSGAGDFDLDGQPDIVWTNTATGERRIWLMLGSAYSSEVSLGVVPAEWVIAGVGDFNSNSGPDLLWRNVATGEVRLWLMNGTSYGSDASLGVLPVYWAISGVADFDRSGGADILWTNTVTGERVIWQMQGAAHSGSATLGIVAANLRISAVGDYNGDGWPDLLMTNVLTDERVIWLLNGATRIGTRSLGTIGAEWVLEQSGLEPIQVPQHDFNGDGKSDLLWENTTTGDRAVWFLNGTSFASSGALGNVDAAWQIAGTADFNADGKPDLVWENTTTGERAVWFMNGSTYTGSAALGTVSTAWHIAAVADFNGDASPDLVWENTTTGERALWFMNGSTSIATYNLGLLATSWRIVGAGDFDRDSNPDLVWENTDTGDRYLWLMDGPDYLESVYLGTAATQWHIAGTADYNSDGGPDILWENTTTGERGLWLMDDTAFNGWVSFATITTEWRIKN